MRPIYRSILFFVFAVSLFSGCKKDTVDTNLIPVAVEGKWGFVDNDGKIVINYQFGSATCFSDGLARVTNDDGKVGYINKSGKYIINPAYKHGTIFSENLAAVVLEDGGPVFINTKGEIKINLPADIDEVQGFREDLAVVKNAKGLYGFIDKDGQTKIGIQFEYAESFSDGLALVKQNDKYGYIDKDGKLKINYQFARAYWFSNGLAVAGTNKNLGYIDKNGNYIINPQFEEADNFNDGLALIKTGKSYGYIDKEGKYSITPQFKNAMPFKDKLAVALLETKAGIIDKKGKFIVNPQFEAVLIVNDNLIIAVNEDRKIGFIDYDGKFLVNPQFNEIDGSLLLNYTSNVAGAIVPRPYLKVESDFFDMSPILNKLMEGTSPESFLNYNKKTTRGEFTSKPFEKIDNNTSIQFINCNTATATNPESYYDPKLQNKLPITYFNMRLTMSGRAFNKTEALMQKLKNELTTKIAGTLEADSTDKNFTITGSHLTVSVNSSYGNIYITVNFSEKAS